MGRWIAWRVQNPTQPPEVALVLGGAKGTGKGKFLRLLCRLFGTHAIQISDRKHLTGSFNAHMMQCCLLFADEAFWPGDKGGEGSLKRLVTEPSLFIEPKGLNGFPAPNRLAVVIAGNEEWLVPASGDERRYAVFKVSEARKQDFEYFAALDNEIDNGGAEAFLHAMLHMDLEGWHPRQDVPQTDALAGQKAISAKPEEQWLGSILDEGVLPYAIHDDGEQRQIVHRRDPSQARSQLLWKHATRSNPKLRHWSELEYRAFLEEHAVLTAEKRSAQGRYRQFPPLPDMRRAWMEKRPWWPAFEDMEADWRFGYEEKMTDTSWMPVTTLPDRSEKGRPKETAKAAAFLRDALADGPLGLHALEVDPRYATHREEAICTAIEQLGVVARRRNGEWEWNLEEAQENGAKRPSTTTTDVVLSEA